MSTMGKAKNGMAGEDTNHGSKVGRPFVNALIANL